MATAPRTPTLKAQRLIEANQASPLVYQSYDEQADETTFRLADGKRFTLSTNDCRSIASYQPRWQHLVAA
jgi:hypothetical protein